MPTIPYSYDLADLGSGELVTADIELTLDVKVDVEWDQPVVTVLAVYPRGGVGDLLASDDTLAKVLGQRIKALAERDPWTMQRVLEEAA